MRRAPWPLLLALSCTQPPPDVPPDPDGGGGCPECTTGCPQGFTGLDGGAGCAAVLSFSECPAGTMPALGTRDCAPVGVRSCPAGFAADPSGWGCREVLPASPCAGATREKLGETACVPVSDCAAPFPPAGATLFVSAQYDAGQLDGTHFATLQAALAAADAGAVIAIDDGVYGGSVVPLVPVTLWGRCAERVVVVPDGGANPGLRLVDVSGTVARNLTVRGFPGGVAVYGGTVELSGLVVEDSTIAGVIVSNGGTSVTMRDSVVRGTRARPTDRQAIGAIVQRQGALLLEEVELSDNEFAGVVASNPDAGLTLRRSVVRGTFPIAQGPAVGTMGVGAYAVDGAGLLVEESALLGNTTEGLLVARGGTRPGSATVRRSTVRDTRRNPNVDDSARGIEVGKGGTLEVDGCTVSGNAEHELLVTEGATARIANTTTVGSTNTAAPSGTGLLVAFDGGAVLESVAFVQPRAVGLEVESGGVARGSDVLVTDVVVALLPGSTSGTQGLGVGTKPGGTVSLLRSVIRRAAGVGVLVSTSNVALEDSVVQETRTKGLSGGRAVSVQDQSTFVATRSAFLGNHEAGLIAFDANTRATLLECSVEDTRPDDFDTFGMGVLATTGSLVELQGTTVTGNRSIGVAASAAGLALRGGWVSFNPVGAHAQDGATLAAADDPVLTLGVLGVSNATRFVGNGARTGLGTVPLPGK